MFIVSTNKLSCDERGYYFRDLYFILLLRVIGEENLNLHSVTSSCVCVDGWLSVCLFHDKAKLSFFYIG